MSVVAEYKTDNDVALIGMDVRLPGAPNVEAFWRNLRDGVESIRIRSEEPTPLPGGELLVHAEASLDDMDLFDAAFFGFSPREAELMDPQIRLFLEGAWGALANAGYDPDQYSGSIGVFGGAAASTYLTTNLMSNPEVLKAAGAGLSSMLQLNDRDALSTLVSYKLNLGGPSVTVQTFCSTSLVAVHLACQSLLSGESDMALAGGVSINVNSAQGYPYREDSIVSPDGHCRAFDAKAKGTIFGNGIGVVVLKRLVDALADGDMVYAVLKGSAVNNDGARKAGYTAPSVAGQAKAIAEALAIAQVDPSSISFVEAHGTGTELGDPIEVEALTRAFRSATARNGFCAIGSVKTNIGHLDRAAGVAGLVKATLALRHQKLPPSLHFQEANPKIDFTKTPFFVNTELRDLKTENGPLRAVVSSLGIGGTNAHVILEEAPEPVRSGRGRDVQLLVLSAHTEGTLESTTKALADHLRRHPEERLADDAYTLALGRPRLDHRRFAICRTHDDAVSALEQLRPGQVATSFSRASDVPVIFMFPGQGAQYVHMARGLYEHERVFRESLDECCDYLAPAMGRDLRQILFAEGLDEQAAAEDLRQTAVTQPAVFATDYALARVWMSWGVQPKAMLGHSLGEYVAACLAGVFSLEDALALVVERGRLMQEVPAGAMLAVELGADEIEPMLEASLGVAAVNSPSQCVVSGPLGAIEELEHRLQGEGVQFTRLRTSHAFHSAMMDPIVERFAACVRSVVRHAPQLPYASNLTGTWITEQEVGDAEYWARHLRHAVRFSDCVRTVCDDSEGILLEVGPGTTLGGLARQNTDVAAGRTVVASLRHPNDQQGDDEFLLHALGQLWSGGARVDWHRFYGQQRRRRVTLPAFAFERKRYWVERATVGGGRRASVGRNADLADWFYFPSWKRSPSRRAVGRPERAATHQAPCLVFADEFQLATRIGTSLERRGCQVVYVDPGEKFCRQDERRYVIDPGNRGDYSSLLAELHDTGLAPSIVVHMWSATKCKSDSEVGRVGEGGTGVGFASLLFLAQAIGDLGVDEPVQIAVITPGMYDVLGEEAGTPENALVLGPVRVVPQEYPNVSCRNIDIALAGSGGVGEGTVAAVIDELLAAGDEPVVAYRNGRRWVQTFEPVRLERSGDGHPRRLRDGGVYLITGGLGGVGMVLARYLAEAVRAKLVLTGRRGIPNRGEWSEAILRAGEDDPTSRKIRAVEALEAAGADVMVCAADTADEAQMREVVEEAHRRYGGLNGVIHAAGVAGGGMVQLKQAEGAADVLRPKVEGAKVLERVCAGMDLDFMVLCSSLTSLVGGIGQVDYCAANAYLDLFARQYTRSTGSFAVSVNWNAWREVGMAVDTDLPQDLKARRAADLREVGITNDEAVDAFQRILSSDEPEIAISPVDLWADHLDRGMGTGPQVTEKEGGGAETKPARTYERPNLTTAYEPPSNEIERSIGTVWQELLGVGKIGIHDNFFELGGHSLMATQVVSRLREEFGADLHLQDVFDAPTVAELGEILLTALFEQEGSTSELESLEGLSPEQVEDELARAQGAEVREGTHE